jgi:hypothetical protein
MQRTIIKRLKEPSTWAGLSVLAALAGVPPGTFELVSQIVMGFAGIAAMALPESSAE